MSIWQTIIGNAGLVGTVGALTGVALGSWLSGRSDQRRMREADRAALRLDRETTYVNFLNAYRQMRRFILTTPKTVTSVPMGGLATPIFDGGEQAWAMVEEATARLQIVADDPKVVAVASELREAMYTLGLARAGVDLGKVAREPIEVMRSVETKFAKAARADLSRYDLGGLRRVEGSSS